MKSARWNAGDEAADPRADLGDSIRAAVPPACTERSECAPSKVEGSESAATDESKGPRRPQNKCQAKPDVFPRNPLKTNTRRSQQVTSFSDSTRIAVPSEQREPRDLIARISIRQYFQVDFAVTHSKQTVRVRAIRQFFGGPSCRERSRREARHACSSQPRLIYIGRANDNPTRIVVPPALTQEGSENRERGICFWFAPQPAGKSVQ